MKRRTLLAGLASLSLLPALTRVTMAEPVKAWRPVFHTTRGGNPRALMGFEDRITAEWYMRAQAARWKRLRAKTPEPSVIVTLDGEFPYDELSHYTIEPDPYHEWMAKLDRLPAVLDVPDEMTPAFFRGYADDARHSPRIIRKAPRLPAVERWSLACSEAFAISMERIARGGTSSDHEEARFHLRQQELAEHFDICPWDGAPTARGFRHESWKTISWLS